jgi:lipopolysaccharide/colanic/teichoic acid biosynthesis glycosyltransferase
MRVDAEQMLAKLCDKDSDLCDQFTSNGKLRKDPRIVPGVGQFLRRYSLDELPQLWSVVTGKMSLVGPRPFPYNHLDLLPSDFRFLRGRTRPGLTGMWQVMARSTGGMREQQIYDSYYIRNWSLWLDLHILFRTVFAVLSGYGAE